MKYLAILLFICLFIAGCKEDEGPDPAPQPAEIMKMNFLNDYIPEPFQVIVFISAPDGTLLADTAFSGNGEYSIINSDPGITIPDTFMVTIVRYDLYWHSLLIRMNTYSGITSSDWTLNGIWPDSIGHATVEFISIPDHSGLNVYSNQGYYNYTSSTNRQTCSIYTSGDSFYMKMKTDADGPRYKWLDNFTPGNNYTLDLSTMEAPSSQVIEFPFQAGYFEGRLWGYADDNYDPGLAFLFDLVLAGIQPANELTLNFPPDKFPNYRTSLLLRESFLTNTIFTYNAIGQIPGDFQQIDAEISAADYTDGVISIDASGNYDAWSGFLYYYSANNEIYEWRLYSAPGSNRIIVPELSPLLGSTFPSIDTASFTFKEASLADAAGAGSYSDLIGLMFSKTKPRHLDQLEHSTVVLQVSQ